MTVGIIGATGYVGAELLRLLVAHEKVDKIVLSSVSFEGKAIDDVYGQFAGFYGFSGKFHPELLNADAVIAESELVFTALPHGIAEKYAAECVASGKKLGRKLIDMSADFRYGEDEAEFFKWYQKKWSEPQLHKEAVYGLPEVNREKIKTARIVGNPGCYVTAATLALLPALRHGLLDLAFPVIVDGKSGISGAGRKEDLTYSFCESGESMMPYSVGAHRHMSEIERNLSIAASSNASSSKVSVIFTPHLIPMSRGIIASNYAKLKTSVTLEDLRKIYSDFYKDEPFVRILRKDKNPSTRFVRLSNFCDIQLYLPQSTSGAPMLQVISALDNMVKGAAGQAVQNMNIMCNFSETAGLMHVPAAL